MNVQAIAAEYDRAAAAYSAAAVAAIDDDDANDEVQRRLDRACAREQMTLMTLIETPARSTAELLVKAAVADRLKANGVWPALAERLLRSIGDDAVRLARG